MEPSGIGLGLGISQAQRHNSVSKPKKKVQNIRKPNAGGSFKEPPLVPLIDPMSFSHTSGISSRDDQSTVCDFYVSYQDL